MSVAANAAPFQNIIAVSLLQELEVHVVKEDFVEEVNKGGAALLIQSFAVSPWGSDPVQRIGEPSAKSGKVLQKSSAGEALSI